MCEINAANISSLKIHHFFLVLLAHNTQCSAGLFIGDNLIIWINNCNKGQITALNTQSLLFTQDGAILQLHHKPFYNMELNRELYYGILNFDSSVFCQKCQLCFLANPVAFKY